MEHATFNPVTTQRRVNRSEIRTKCNKSAMQYQYKENDLPSPICIHSFNSSSWPRLTLVGLLVDSHCPILNFTLFNSFIHLQNILIIYFRSSFSTLYNANSAAPSVLYLILSLSLSFTFLIPNSIIKNSPPTHIHPSVKDNAIIIISDPTHSDISITITR